MLPFGLSAQSSTAQASPFYNQNAGIFFESDVGAIENEGNTAEAVSTMPPTRQTAGGIAPQSLSSMPAGFSTPAGDDSLTTYIIGGVLVVAIALVFLFRKHL